MLSRMQSAPVLHLSRHGRKSGDLLCLLWKKLSTTRASCLAICQTAAGSAHQGSDPRCSSLTRRGRTPSGLACSQRHDVGAVQARLIGERAFEGRAMKIGQSLQRQTGLARHTLCGPVNRPSITLLA